MSQGLKIGGSFRCFPQLATVFRCEGWRRWKVSARTSRRRCRRWSRRSPVFRRTNRSEGSNQNEFARNWDGFSPEFHSPGYQFGYPLWTHRSKDERPREAIWLTQASWFGSVSGVWTYRGTEQLHQSKPQREAEMGQALWVWTSGVVKIDQQESGIGP